MIEDDDLEWANIDIVSIAEKNKKPTLKKVVVFDLENVLIDFSRIRKAISRGNAQNNNHLLSKGKLIDGIWDIITILKKYGVTICVMSLHSEQFISLFINHHELPVDHIYGRTDLAYNISIPKQVTRLLDDLGVSKDDIVAFSGTEALTHSLSELGICSHFCNFTSKRDISTYFLDKPSDIFESMGIQLETRSQAWMYTKEANDIINGIVISTKKYQSSKSQGNNIDIPVEYIIADYIIRNPECRLVIEMTANRAGWQFNENERLSKRLFISCLTNIINDGATKIKDRGIRGGFLALEIDKTVKNNPKDYVCPLVDINKYYTDKADCEAGITLFNSKNYKDAFSFFESLSEENIWRGYYLAKFYRDGLAGEKNLDLAIQLCSFSAKKGLPVAAMLLGIMYEELTTSNHRIFKNYWYWVAYENYYDLALNNDLESQDTLGWCYIWGRGIEESRKEAEKWFKKAISGGLPKAYRSMGHISLVYDGDEEGWRRWQTMAAEKGDLPSIRICALTEEEKNNSDKAFYWYLKGAQLGDSSLQYCAGVCYYLGQGVQKDMSLAVYWTKLAATGGDSRAQCNLGYFYSEGLGLKKDQQEAIKWYQQSADKGQVEALCNMGEIYFEGLGVDKDYSLAFSYFHQAAEKNYAEAQYRLGLCYRDGIGTKMNPEEAQRWFQKAASNGHEEAKKNL